MPGKRIDQLELDGRRVLMRLDLNVPLDEDGSVADDTRIRAALPSMEHALSKSASLVLCSHLGKPKGKRVPSLSLEPVGLELARILDRDVILSDSPVGDGPRKLARELRPGGVLLLENLRFDPGETANDEAFARSLAGLGEVYVNDAFGTAHRAHASVVGVPRLIGEKGMGFLMSRELEKLGVLLGDVQRPFVALLGGVKVSDKLPLMEKLLDKVDVILVGGAMAYTFLKAKEVQVGDSLVEAQRLYAAREVLKKAGYHKVRLLLPDDHVVADGLGPGARVEQTGTAIIPEGWRGMDIGPLTRETFIAEIGKAGTVFWNGPMGLFEREPFHEGTMALARAVARCKGYTVVGGGDSLRAVHRAGVGDEMDHISTGGGASLKLLEGADLPGVRALA